MNMRGNSSKSIPDNQALYCSSHGAWEIHSKKQKRVSFQEVSFPFLFYFKTNNWLQTTQLLRSSWKLFVYNPAIPVLNENSTCCESTLKHAVETNLIQVTTFQTNGLKSTAWSPNYKPLMWHLQVFDMLWLPQNHQQQSSHPLISP